MPLAPPGAARTPQFEMPPEQSLRRKLVPQGLRDTSLQRPTGASSGACKRLITLLAFSVVDSVLGCATTSVSLVVTRAPPQPSGASVRAGCRNNPKGFGSTLTT